jgi:tetrahydromethanopterin S-methyltransferase subunit B
MKLIQPIRTLTLAALGVAGLLLAGSNASAAGYKLADKVGADIAEFRDEIVELKKAVDTTMVSLDKIVAQATSDPRKAFKAFDSSVPKIDSAAAKAKKRADDMRARGKEYFDKWEKDLAGVSNPDIRKLAEERKAKLQTTFGNIKTSMDPAREQFNAWLGPLKDLQKYLSQDLTISGIDAAKDLIVKTKTDGMELQKTIDKIITELNTIVATITPAKVKK